MTRTGDLTTSDSAVTNDHITSELPAAVLWDMDGTLVDTEPYWFAAERDLVDRFGHGDWPDEHAHAMVGFDLRDSAAYMQEHGGVDLPADEIVERLLDGVIARLHREIPWRPGGRELLAELNDAGVPCALVTMSWRRFVDPVMAALPDGSFVATVTGDEVPLGHGKPHPDPYLIAADACGAAPEHCLAIEDSPTGVRSALDAGCRVLGVPNVRALRREPGLTIIESLADVRANDLTTLNEVDPGNTGMAATDFDPGLQQGSSPEMSSLGKTRQTSRSSSRPSRSLLAGVFAVLTALVLSLIWIVGLGGESDGSTADQVEEQQPDRDEWITFPEGFTIAKVAERLSNERPGMDAQTFLFEAESADVPSEFGRPAGTTSAEGLLFPNTYKVLDTHTEAQVVDQMIGLMETVAIGEESIVEGAAELGLTPYEVLIVASLIEREARLERDRPQIARVIYNRLELGMKLQIDASLYYSQDAATPFTELRELDTPYNTYLVAGLPPTPIASPGRAAIRAALNPSPRLPVDHPECATLADPEQECRLLFYVRADEAGGHNFAVTYEQHLANIEDAREAGFL